MIIILIIVVRIILMLPPPTRQAVVPHGARGGRFFPVAHDAGPAAHSGAGGRYVGTPTLLYEMLTFRTRGVVGACTTRFRT